MILKQCSTLGSSYKIPDSFTIQTPQKKPIVRANTNIWNPQNKVLFSLKEPLGKNKVQKKVMISSILSL